MRTLRYILLFATIFLCWGSTQAQEIVAGEYFFNTDPGVGNAIAIPLAPGNTIQTSFVADASTLPAGFHTLNVRLKDANGVWGVAKGYLVQVLGPQENEFTPAPEIVAGEYFFNTDPGPGNANSFAVTPGATTQAAFVADASALPAGFHTLNVRLKDADGVWGVAKGHLVQVLGPQENEFTPAPEIVAGEYFFNTDPGPGNANSFAVTPGATTQAAFVADASALPAGFHTLNVRLKDADGVWGVARGHLVQVLGPQENEFTPAPEIVAGEYYFNTDPGFGNGVAVNVPTGSTAQAVFLADASTLPAGTHDLVVRFKDADGTWGFSRNYNFTVTEVLGNADCADAFPLDLTPYGGCLAGASTGTTNILQVPEPVTCAPDMIGVWYIIETGTVTAMLVELGALSQGDLALQVFESCGGVEVYCGLGATHQFATQPQSTYLLKVLTSEAMGFTVCASNYLDCAGVPNGTASIDQCGVCSGGDTGIGPDACLDCEGVANGTAFIDDCGTCVGGSTGLSACVQDCLGDFGGTAFIDECGTCVGGNSGLTPCVLDCNGVDNGTAYIDNCGNCAGGDTGVLPCPQDCHGTWGGSAFIDDCGNCVGGSTGATACVADCNGVLGGTAYLDNCNTCVDGNTGQTACVADCNNEWGGTAYLDDCNICVGGSTGLGSCVEDCNGVLGGTASLDACGVCSGGNTGITPGSSCADCAGVPNGLALVDGCGVCRLPTDPNFVTAVQSLSFSGNANFVDAILYPLLGAPSDTYTAEVIYTNSENNLPPLGFPRLILDFEGNGIFTNTNDRTVLMTEVDASDQETGDGKLYRGTVLGLPSGTNWTARVQVQAFGCLTQIGPFNYPDVLVAPDLEIFANDITFSDPNPDVNSPLTINATLRNNSGYVAENFVVRMINQFEPDVVYPDIVVASLAPNAQTTVTWNIITPNEVAWCPIQVIIDATNVITETNELNNSAVRPFTNGPFNIPGSIQVNASASPSNSIIYPGTTLISVSGYAYYDDTAVPLQDPSVAGSTVTLVSPQGATYTVLTNSAGYFSATIPAVNTPGTFTINGSVTDFTLTGIFSVNYTRVQQVVNCPEWMSPNVNIVQAQQYQLVGQPISGTVTVNNSNCAAVEVSTLLSMNQTGGTPLIADATVPPLAAGGSFVYPFSGVVFDTPGTYTICATTDGALQLGNPAYNNTSCRSVTVHPPLPDIIPWSGPSGNTFLCLSGPPGFTLKNNGAVPTGSFTCSVDVYLGGVLQTTFTQVVPSIGPFSYGSFTLPYTYPSTGTYTFDLECDVPLPGGVVTELNENNNTASYTRTLNECKPDLKVSIPCFEPVLPVDPAFPGTVTYSARIQNTGNAPAAGPILVRFNVSTGGSYDVVHAPGLVSGESRTVSVEAPSVAPATAILSVIVDPENTVDESNENNNTTADDLCWEFQPVPDLSCGGGWSWGNNAVINQTSPVRVGLRNNEMYAASSVKVRFEVSGPDIVGTALLGDVIVNNVDRTCGCPMLAALPTTFLYSSFGTYTFTFTVDPDNVYTECNEANNVITRTVNVTNLPDLRILSQYINPSLLNPDVNEPITFDVTYENIGLSNLGQNCDLRFLINEQEHMVIQNVPGLVNGGTNTVAITMPWATDIVGLHVSRAVIDPDNVVIESNEMNNEATRSFIVGAAANLFFAGFVLSDDDPSIGDQITISGSVANNGDLSTTGDVVFYYVTPSQDTVPFQTLPSISVLNGDTTAFSGSWIVTQTPTVIIARIVNVTDLEFNYTDNEVSRPIGSIDAQLVAVPDCAPLAPGSITVYPIGGVGPFTFEWNTAFTGPTLLAPPGEYEVTITDADGRTTTKTAEIVIDPDCGVFVSARALLDGPFNPATGLMNDNLRTLGLIPADHPYSGAPWNHGGTEEVDPSVLTVSGNKAIVDWVLLELRDGTAPATVIAKRACLIQSNGDIVDIDGVSPVKFAEVNSGEYHLAVRHRNHLGCMTLDSVAMGGSPVTIDFTQPATATYGSDARKVLAGSVPVAVLWAGDVTFDGIVRYTGQDNDRDPILQYIGGTIPTATLSGQYKGEDVNMDGSVKYTGDNNDRDAILQSIGGTIPTSVKEEQIP